MFCCKCGSKVDDNAKFCANCGTVVESISQQVQQPQMTTNNDLPSLQADWQTQWNSQRGMPIQQKKQLKKMQWWHILLIVLGTLTVMISVITAIGRYSDDDGGSYSDNNNYGNYTDTNNDTTSVSIGDVIKFGSYEQDNNYDNGDEDIEWIVLEVSNDKLLLISKYVLEASPYTYSEDGSFWNDSAANASLVDTIYTCAFSYQERKKLTTEVIGSDDGGYTPSDLVFALSSTEFEKYGSVISGLYDCFPTAYAKAEGVLVSSSEKNAGKSYWWVRDDSTYGTVMAPSGVAWVGTMFKEDEHGVRPAIWISADYQTEAGTGVTVSNDMVGTWDTVSGGDEHTITISADGKMKCIDGSDTLTVDYTCYSATEIAISDTESDLASMVFVLSNGKLIRYDEDGLEDGYTYSKRINTSSELY